MTKIQKQITKICLAALFLALGWLTPTLTGQIPEFGNMFCPMHLPVMLCGFILGPAYGALIGFITPLTRSLIFGMPPIMPTALSMAFELLTYGFLCGAIFYLLNKYAKKIPTIATVYIALVSAMIVGRLVWGFVNCMILLSMGQGSKFTGIYFLTEAFANAWPGILIQLVVVPAIFELLYTQKLLTNLLPDYAKIFKGKRFNKDNNDNQQPVSETN